MEKKKKCSTREEEKRGETFSHGFIPRQMMKMMRWIFLKIDPFTPTHIYTHMCVCVYVGEIPFSWETPEKSKSSIEFENIPFCVHTCCTIHAYFWMQGWLVGMKGKWSFFKSVTKILVVTDRWKRYCVTGKIRSFHLKFLTYSYF